MTLSLEVLRRGIAAEAHASRDLMVRLAPAFVLHADDLADLERIEAITAEIVGVASRITAEEMPAAQQRAVDQVVMPFVEAAGASVQLPAGWESRLQAALDFYLRQAGEKVTNARETYLTQVRHLLEEASATRIAPEIVLSRIRNDVQGASGKPGPMFGAFRAAVREAVRQGVGHAWTQTWMAGFSSIRAPRDQVLSLGELAAADALPPVA